MFFGLLQVFYVELRNLQISPNEPFILTTEHPGVREGATPFPALFHFTIGKHSTY